MIGIDLEQSELDLLLRVARRLPVGMQDEFFKDVADRLRPIRDLRTTDINHAIASAWERCRALRDDPA